MAKLTFITSMLSASAAVSGGVVAMPSRSAPVSR